jgi:hypothetical protein
MAQDNGHYTNKAIEVVRHLSEKFRPEIGGGFQTILVALAKVYRRHDNNIVDHATMSVIKCEKEVHGVSESDFLEAIREVFQPKIPIVYPTQFRPVMIIHPNGTVLWMETASETEATPPAEPAAVATADERT